MAFIDLTTSSTDSEVEGSDDDVVYLEVTGSVAVKNEAAEQQLDLPSDGNDEDLPTFSTDHSSLFGDDADVDSRYEYL